MVGGEWGGVVLMVVEYVLVGCNIFFVSQSRYGGLYCGDELVLVSSRVASCFWMGWMGRLGRFIIVLVYVLV